MIFTDTLWLDTETYSEVDLKTHGTFRYAEHESTRIMLAQWAFNDEDPQVADYTDPVLHATAGEIRMQHALRDPSVLLVAHNVAFDRALIRSCWGLDIPIERWYCVMVQALAHGLPGALGKLGPVLGLPEDQHKDKRGRDLIQLFCKPRPKNMKVRRATAETHPLDWEEFVEYSRQDIPSMRAVSKALPQWNYAMPMTPGRAAGHRERKLWYLDQTINTRGFKVDVDLARGAVRATTEEKARLKQEVVDATDGAVTGPSKRDQMLKYILAEYDVDLPDLRADTLRRRIDDPELPDAVRLLLSLRLEATKTSTAKYTALLNAVSDDGRLRNTLQFAGAGRTERWAGRIFQPQNMTRPTLFQCVIDLGIDAFKSNTEHELVPLLLDSVMELAANAVRGCITADVGRKLTVADLANIEGRKLVFLSGEEWKLQAFREYDAGTGPDMYVAAYARAFGIPYAQVTKKQRQIGKVMELALGYEGGVAAFLTFAAVYNMDLDELTDAVHSSASKEALAAAYGVLEWAKKKGRSTFGLSDEKFVACEVLKASWREAHPETKTLWKLAGDAVRAAIGNPGTPYPIGDHLVAQRDGAWLRIRLPSGRCLCYLHPKVAESGDISYMGVNQYTKQWARIKTYGGKLIENATQAAARDVLAWSMPAIDAAGYPIVLTVHDELLTEPEDNPLFTHEKLATMMAVVPPWAPGLPLAAAGFEAYRYKKES